MNELTDHLLLLLADALTAAEQAWALCAPSDPALVRVRRLATALAKAIEDYWFDGSRDFDDEDERQLHFGEYETPNDPT